MKSIIIPLALLLSIPVMARDNGTGTSDTLRRDVKEIHLQDRETSRQVKKSEILSAPIHRHIYQRSQNPRFRGHWSGFNLGFADFGDYDIVPGDKVDIIIAPKGFGSENMSRVFMLKPADGIEGVKDAILTAVRDAGPNACPPMVVGVGIGGTFEKCALLAKKALTRNLDEERPTGYVRELEDEMLEKINSLGIGPGGLGGSKTALAVNVETYPTHIAGLPVAVNICCHVNRHVHRVI